ncbi:MAG: hypothetical protein M3Q48_02150 [Actinomycetota bacterium]|nr:hypothetical protein [Actinomycetota bacterium]
MPKAAASPQLARIASVNGWASLVASSVVRASSGSGRPMTASRVARSSTSTISGPGVSMKDLSMSSSSSGNQRWAKKQPAPWTHYTAQ